MVNVKLPYGKNKINISIPKEQLNGILTSDIHSYYNGKSERKIVKEAIYSPIGSERLSDLVKGKKNIVIITSDHTRPVPSDITIPLLLEEIKKGNPNIDIKILVATGCHRASTNQELKEKFGSVIVNDMDIEVHNCRNKENMINLGKLPSGGDLILNELIVKTDLLIAEGFIEPHFFAGFSGGRKSVLPGVASKETVLANHCAEFIDHPNARMGILKGNPIHEDMLYAAEMVDLQFILNVVLDSNKNIISAFSGHREKAHKKGCEFVSEFSQVDLIPSDIVITTNGGYPLDQNIYQSVKGMTTAEATLKEAGVIIMVSECIDGHGSEDLYKTFRKADKVETILKDILKRGRKETKPDQWQTQILARILLNNKVIMVTEVPQQLVNDLHMYWAEDVDEAINMAQEFVKKKNPSITVIPDGVSVFIGK